MIFNSALFKGILIVRKLRQVDVSIAARIPETTLSKIVNLKYKASPRQINSIAKVLKIDSEILIVKPPVDIGGKKEKGA